jgi:FK506-binding nuclear protein
LFCKFTCGYRGVKAEIDGASKKKKKGKDKSTVMDTGKVNNEEKEVKLHDSPADPVSTKQKKKKNKKKSASEGDTSEQSAKNDNVLVSWDVADAFHIGMLITWLNIVWQCSSPNFSNKDTEKASAQEANKKNKKKKAHDISRSESQAGTGLGESDSKEPLQTRTFANGMMIQEVEMGKPDGKKASRGKKVNISGIWGASKGWSSPSYPFIIAMSHCLLQF